MREFPKIRKTLKWGGAAVAVFAAVVWAAACLWAVEYRGARGKVSISGHRMYVTVIRPPASFTTSGWTIARFRPIVFEDGRRYYGELELSVFINPNTWDAAVPFWAIVAAGASTAGICWLLELCATRRRRRDRCPSCGYDLAGINATSPCPECGAMLVASNTDATLEKPTSPES